MTILRSGTIALCLTLLTACQTMPDVMWMQASAESPQATVDETVSVTISDLYSTPSLDAQIARSVKDLRLLTFADDAALPPGVSGPYKLTNLSKFCGLRTLPVAGVVVDASFDARQRKTLFDYARQYNQIVLAACEKDFGKALR